MTNRRRRSDVVGLWIAAIAFVQLAGVAAWTTRIYAQRAPVQSIEQLLRNQQQIDRTAALEARVTIVEALNIAPRLAVLEDMKKRLETVEILGYAQVASILGLLVLGAIQIKGQRSRRASSE